MAKKPKQEEVQTVEQQLAEGEITVKEALDLFQQNKFLSSVMTDEGTLLRDGTLL